MDRNSPFSRQNRLGAPFEAASPVSSRACTWAHPLQLLCFLQFPSFPFSSGSLGNKSKCCTFHCYAGSRNFTSPQPRCVMSYQGSRTPEIPGTDLLTQAELAVVFRIRSDQQDKILIKLQRFPGLMDAPVFSVPWKQTPQELRLVMPRDVGLLLPTPWGRKGGRDEM